MVAASTNQWFFIGTITIILMAVPIVDVYRDCAYICEFTGSRKGCRRWILGLETRHWYKESELERFIKERFPNELDHHWTSYAGTGRNIFGSVVVRSHGSPGPVSRLGEYSGDASPTEMKHLYDTLRHGSDSDRKAVIDQVLETVFPEKGKTEPEGATNGSQPIR